MRLGLAAATVMVAVAHSLAAHAVEVQTQVSTQRVAVGQSFVVQLVAMADGSNGGRASDSRLPLPAGMTAGPPSVAPQSQVSFINGQMSQRTGVTVTWTVTSSKLGSFKVGPPSVTLGSEPAQGQIIPIEVVTGSTGGGTPGARRPFDPFNFMNPFGNGSPFPPGFNFRSPFDDDNQQQDQEPSYPEELRVDKAPDPLAFLRATITPTRVVVGQQVNLRIYAYGGRGVFSFGNGNEPSHAEFLAFDAEQENPKLYVVPIEGTRYLAAKLRDLPLFPLRAGTLRAGGMKAGFSGRGYPATDPTLGLLRESNWVDLIVTEPPLRGRPPGYKIGDVGDYKLSATVEPREIMAGEAVAVVATLAGTGNVPFKIQTPEQRGVEWLEPSLTEHMVAQGGIVQGSRTFSYVVHMTEPGSVDLGELSLPYYDPKRRAYAVARARLGGISVKVNPNAKSAPAEPTPTDRLAGVLHARDALGKAPSASRPLSDRRGFWLALWLAPFGVLFSGSALTAASRLREKLRVRGTSLGAQLEAALREARTLAQSDPGAAVNAVERAVFTAIELKLGLKARAILKSDLARNLGQHRLPPERAQALVRILEDCDALRFVGAASAVDPVELAERAETHARALQSDKLRAES